MERNLLTTQASRTRRIRIFYIITQKKNFISLSYLNNSEIIRKFKIGHEDKTDELIKLKGRTSVQIEVCTDIQMCITVFHVMTRVGPMSQFAAGSEGLVGGEGR
ncbi:hypothetical protein AAHE18_02G050300 [Arachis hypogaea]